ncbi:MAG: hypothetical protein VXW87_02325 [Pseudomonadota bacterium]|nr:hypothetical protein [Pseudomonadota bacterium]
MLKGIRLAIKNAEVTQDFARHMDGVEGVSTSEFADAVCKYMK